MCANIAGASSRVIHVFPFIVDIAIILCALLTQNIFRHPTRSKRWVVPFRLDREAYIEYVMSFRQGLRSTTLPDKVLAEIDRKIRSGENINGAAGSDAAHARRPPHNNSSEEDHRGERAVPQQLASNGRHTAPAGHIGPADEVGGPPTRRSGHALHERSMSTPPAAMGSTADSFGLFSRFQKAAAAADRCDIKRVGPRRRRNARPPPRSAFVPQQ